MMDNRIAIGIDFGTTTSEVAFFSKNEPEIIKNPFSVKQNPIFPSVVAVNSSGKIVVGEKALPYIGDPERCILEIKRQMGKDVKITLGNRDYKPQEIGAFIFKELQRYASLTLNCDIDKVVLAVPANYNDFQKRAIKDAAEIAGLKVLRLINEPTAAALSYGIKKMESDEKVLVFDFGGGTLDVTILAMVQGIIDVFTSYGEEKLGGRDIDDVIMRHLIEDFTKKYGDYTIPDRSKRLLKANCERAKIELSNSDTANIYIPGFAFKGSSAIPLEAEIKLQDFNRYVGPILNRCIECIKKTLARASLNPEDVTTVLLVGGSSNIPIIIQELEELFGKKPEKSVHPEFAVALGSSIQSAIAQGLLDSRDSIILSDVAPHTLGLEVIGISQGQLLPGVIDTLIKKDTKIPYSVERKYSLIHENQKEVEINIYQGDGKMAKDCLLIASGKIYDIPVSETGMPHKVEVRFSYNVSSLIEIEALIPATGQSTSIKFKHSAERMDITEKKMAKDVLEAVWEGEMNDNDNYLSLIARAKEVKEEVYDTDVKNKIQGLIDKLNLYIAQDDRQNITQTETELSDLLFLIETGRM